MLDNRIGMDENGTQTWTLYDGSDPVMDFNSSGSLEMRYLNGPTGDLVDSIIARESAGGTVAWYLPDRLGTIRDLINNSGSIIDHVDYSAFGNQLDESSPTNGDRIMGFAGMERDTVTGMNLAVNRVQDPGTGRWTSPDPLGFGAGDADLYRYVTNGPTSVRDALGLGDKPWWLSGWLTVDPGFEGPTGIGFLGENESQGPGVLPLQPGTTVPADAIILPCIGLIKIPAWAHVTLKSYNRAKNQYLLIIKGGPPSLYPIGGPNPFRQNVPGNGADEGRLPDPSFWDFANTGHGVKMSPGFKGRAYISSCFNSNPLPWKGGFYIYHYPR